MSYGMVLAASNADHTKVELVQWPEGTFDRKKKRAILWNQPRREFPTLSSIQPSGRAYECEHVESAKALNTSRDRIV